MTPPPIPDTPLPIVLHAEGEQLTIDAVAHSLYGQVTMLPPIKTLDELDERIRTDRKFDVLVVDVVFRHVSALSRIGRWTTQFPELKIIVLTGLSGLPLANQCMAAGARGVVSKLDGPEELRKAISAVHRGETFISKDFGVASDVLSPALAGLGPRTLRILVLLRRGLSHRAIAQLENITEKSVQYHERKLRQALGMAPGRGGWTTQ
ncbi:MAG: hypothetical protein ABI542_01905 [Gemmatimonadota bacterium]